MKKIFSDYDPWKLKAFFSIVLLFIYLPSSSLAEDPRKHHVIIDTDCGPDDLRAINLLFSSTETDILAITSEDGVLEPDEGYLRIIGLLKELGHQGIQTSQGIIARNEDPGWRGLARQINWGKEPISFREPTEIKEFLVKLIEEEAHPVEIICMGPLTNIANAVLMKSSIKKQISKIIWFDQCQPELKWTNYSMDCLSANYLLKTQIPIYRISAGNDAVEFTPEFLEEIGKIYTPYAQKIYRAFSSDSIKNKLSQEPLKLWDDLCALYLYYPELFKRDTTYADSAGHVIKPKDGEQLKKQYLEHLESYNHIESNVFNTFPADTGYYRPDVRNMMIPTIRQYGIREWKAITLTEEIHPHLGINALIGAKMGILALKYFRAQPGSLEITSFCGHEPPLSCINEGLQIAGGTNLNHANMEIKDDVVLPKARFRYNNKTIEIKLKPPYHKKIQKALEEARNNHPVHSQGYKSFIREKALSYWKNWDRQEIFQIND